MKTTDKTRSMDDLTEVERRLAGLEPTRPLTLAESRELMSRNLDRLCVEMFQPWLEDERNRIARGLRPMLLSVLPATDDEGNAAADVADGMLDALGLMA